MCHKGLPSEATGRRSNVQVTTSTVSTGEKTEESLEERCQRLQEELAAAELQRMTTAYAASQEVDTVTGERLGPLFYSEVPPGVPVRALIDTGSSAMILSFETFKRIGRVANIPSSSLLAADTTLRDYTADALSLLVLGWT